MECMTVLELLRRLDAGGAPPESTERVLLEHLGLIQAEEAPDAGEEEDFSVAQGKARRLVQRIAALRAELSGASAEDGRLEELVRLEGELGRARTRLLDLAATRQRRASDESGPRIRLSWRGRELLDELSARAWRLEGRSIADFLEEMTGLRARMRARAASARRIALGIGPLLPTLPGLDLRSVALSLALEGEDPMAEKDRVETLPRMIRELEDVFGWRVPPELAALVTAHPERAKLLQRAALLSQEQFMARVFSPDLSANSLGVDAPWDLVGRARGIAGVGRPVGVMELLLARAEVAPADLLRLSELEAHLRPMSAARHVAGLLLAFGLGDEPGLDRFRQIHRAFEELHAGGSPASAVLLAALDGPIDELMDNLRLAAEEIERADLAETGLENMVQGARLLLATVLEAGDPASWASPGPVPVYLQQAGLRVRLPAMLATPLLALWMEAASWPLTRARLASVPLPPPGHRTSGFHG